MPSPSSRHKARGSGQLCIFYGWCVVAVCVLARGAKSWGQANVLLFAVPSVGTDLSLSSEAMSLVFLASTLTGAAMQIPLGRLVDRAGARTCMTLGLVFLGAGMLGFSVISSPVGLYLAFLALRSSFAIDLFVDQCISQWFDKLRGRALAASNVGAQILGGILASEAAEWWTSAWGWRHCYVAAGVMCLFTAIPILIFVRRNPAAIGLLPDGNLPCGIGEGIGDDTCERDTDCCIETSGAGTAVVSSVVGSPCLPGDQGTEGTEDAELTVNAVHQEHRDWMIDPSASLSSSSWTCSEAFRTFAAWSFLFLGLTDGYMGAATTFLRLEILTGEAPEGARIPFDVAAWVNIPNSIMYMVTVFFAGMLIDRGVEPPRLLLVSVLANLLSIYAVVAHQPISATQGLLHGLLQGLNWGMSNTVKSAAYASYFGREHVGSILGVEKFVNIGGTAIGPAALSTLHRVTGSFAKALQLSALLPLLSGLLLCFARRPQHRSEMLTGSRSDTVLK